MKYFLNSIPITLLAIFLLVLIFWVINNRQKDILLNAPNGNVAIRFDNYGIPHISSEKSDLDVFFALGYVHAKD